MAVAKVTGMHSLSKKLDELSKFSNEADGLLGEVSCDPNDPGSIDRAMHKIETIVDEHASFYPRNNLVQGIADSMKETYTKQLLQKSAAKRAEREA